MATDDKPLVSVILPVFNGEKTILRAITSIRNQTFNDWELIIINDGSMDKTPQLIASVKNPRIKVISVPHSGISKALNFGIKMAEGDFIARMDADDECLPNRFKRQIECLQKHAEVGLVACQVEHIGSSDQAGYKYYVDWTNQLLTPAEIYQARFQDSPFAHPSIMFRKTMFYKYGGYSEADVPEDFELWLRWLERGVHMVKLPDVLLKWHDSPNRLSRVGSNYSHDQFNELKAQYFARWYFRKKINRPVWIFGTGRVVNNRVKPLKAAGIKPEKFIDIVPKADPHIICYKDLPKAEGNGPFILSYVSDRKGKTEISNFLKGRNYAVGKDFLMMA